MSMIKRWVKTVKPLHNIFDKMRFCWFARGLKIKNEGKIYGLKKYVRGKNNRMIVGAGSQLEGVTIHIVGKNNELVFGKNCIVKKGNSFWMEGNNIKIVVGDNCTFNISNHVNAQEDDMEICIGEKCMFSNNVHIRTSDSHPIYDMSTKKRLNPAKSVYLGDHIWVAPQSAIYKGVRVGNGSIIASRSLVTHDVPPNSLVAGSPAKVVKTDVFWASDLVLKKG